MSSTLAWIPLALAAAAPDSGPPPEANETLDPLEVVGRDLRVDDPRAITELGRDRLAPIALTHPAELFARIPGAWITRGSGQEHLTAIRSPLLTGAGGCGALLYLEAGVPIRPPGFCNVNNLFEVDLALASSVRVQRGPGGLGHASGGLHGVIDVRPRDPWLDPVDGAWIEYGSDDYREVGARLTGSGERAALGIDARYTRAGSFRVDEGYEHGFLAAHHRFRLGNADGSTLLSLAQLDQDTAGFITGFEAYRDADRRDDNDNPEAFRRASAARLVTRLSWLDADGGERRLTAFARRSRMNFLQHFLPGKPLEKNGQISAGVQFDRSRPIGSFTLEWGLDAEVFDGFLFEVQDQPAQGSAFLVETRPVGVHYDYEVFGLRAGGYLALEHDFGERWTARAGVHADRIRYDYETELAPGNLNDRGEPCGFGGCLFTRPADRTDTFTEFAPELTLSRRFDSADGPLRNARAWLRLARGYRAPQATELYRLQRGQQVADLDSETLDAIELGAAGRGWADWQLIAFAQRKRNFIFRDGQGFNVSEGRTRALGVEFDIEKSVAPGLVAGLRGTWARHRWDFDRDLGGEVIESGNTIASAPERLASADLTWRPVPRWSMQLAAESTGRYYLDEANSRRYGGHLLVHGFAAYRDPSGWSVEIKLRNLGGERYAERADFAFGSYRYFPGPGRSVFVQLGWRSRP